MAYKKGQHPNSKKALKPIKKGEIRNPAGAGAHSFVRQRVTREWLHELIDIAMGGNIEHLKEIVKDPSSPALKVGIATSMITAINRGDWHTMQSIMERILGKVPVALDHKTTIEQAPQIIVTLPSNGREIKE